MTSFVHCGVDVSGWMSLRAAVCRAVVVHCWGFGRGFHGAVGFRLGCVGLCCGGA